MRALDNQIQSILRQPIGSSGHTELYEIIQSCRTQPTKEAITIVTIEQLTQIVIADVQGWRTRRWVGILLLQALVINRLDKNVLTVTLTDSTKKSLGQILLSPNPEDLKLVASRIISEELWKEGVDLQDFFEAELPEGLLRLFPQVQDSQVLDNFDNFMEEIVNLGIAEERATFINQAVFVTGDSQRLVNKVGRLGMVLDSETITIIAISSDLGFEILDVDLKHISNVQRQSVEFSQLVDPKEISTYQIVLSMKGPILVNATTLHPKQLSIGYGNDSDVIELIKEITCRIDQSKKQGVGTRNQIANDSQDPSNEPLLESHFSTTNKTGSILKTSQGVTRSGLPHVALPTPSRSSGSFNLQALGLGSATTVRSQMRNETGESAQATAGKLMSSKKPNILKQSRNTKEVGVSDREHEQAVGDFDVPLSPTERKPAKKAVKPKAATKKKPKANSVKAPRATAFKGKNGLDSNNVSASATQPRRSARNLKGRGVGDEKQQNTSEHEDEIIPTSQKTRKDDKKVTAHKDSNEVEDDETGHASSETQMMHTKGKDKEIQPLAAKNGTFKAPHNSASRQLQTQKQLIGDIIDSPQNRKPHLISFSVSGPRNQGTSSKLKRRLEPVAPQGQPPKRVKRTIIKNIRAGEILDVTQEVGEIDAAFPSAGSPPQSNHDEDETRVQPIEVLDLESPKLMISDEPSGSQLSKRVDGNGSPYNAKVQLQVSSRTSRSDTRLDSNKDNNYLDMSAPVAKDIEFKFPVSLPVHTSQQQQSNTACFQGQNNSADIVAIRGAIKSLPQIPQLLNSVTQSSSPNKEVLSIDVSEAIEQPRAVYVPTPFADTKQDETRARSEYMQLIQAKSQLLPQARTSSRRNAVTTPLLVVTDAMQGWDEDEETLLNGEPAVHQSEVLSTRGFERGQIPTQRKLPYDDPSTPGSSIPQNRFEHDQARSVSVEGGARSRVTAIREAVIWEQGLSFHGQSVAESLMQITQNLLHHLTKKETTVCDVVEDYGKCGSALIEKLESSHQKEYNAVTERLKTMLLSVLKGTNDATDLLDQCEGRRSKDKDRVEHLVKDKLHHQALWAKELEKLMRKYS